MADGKRLKYLASPGAKVPVTIYAKSWEALLLKTGRAKLYNSNGLLKESMFPSLIHEDSIYAFDLREATKSGTHKEKINLIPNGTFLTKAGEDYTLESALAELIDNCIEATVNNCGARIIEINVPEADDIGDHTITVKDNGCGMSSEDLKRMAPMGKSLNKEKRTATTYDSILAKEAPYLSSNISQYGKGSKAAGYKLCKEMVVRTKRKNDPLVTSITMSRSAMEEVETRGDNNEYSADISHDVDNDNAAQYTVLTLNDVEPTKLKDLRTLTLAGLRRRIAFFYQYYLKGPQGVPAFVTLYPFKPEALENPPRDFKPIDIRVNGESLHENDFLGEIPRFAVVGPRYKMNFSGYEKQYNVEVRYYYHAVPPPDIRDLDPRIPFQEPTEVRFDYFWVGRLLPNIHDIPRWVKDAMWDIQKQKIDVPMRALHRVQGFVLFDHHWEPNTQKTAMNNNQEIWSEFLGGHGMKSKITRARTDFITWLRDVHLVNDYEISVIGKPRIEMVNGVEQPHYSEFQLNAVKLKDGDHCTFTGGDGGIMWGTFLAIYPDGVGAQLLPSKYKVRIRPQTHKTLPIVEVTANNIRERKDPKAFNKHKTKEMNKIPVLVTWPTKENVDRVGEFPKTLTSDDMSKNTYSKWQAVLRGGKKAKKGNVIQKGDFVDNYTVHCAIFQYHLKKKKKVFESTCQSENADKDGVFSGNLNLSKFSPGKYMLELSCELPEGHERSQLIREWQHDFVVTVGTPHCLYGAADEKSVYAGGPMPALRLRLEDGRKFPIPMDNYQTFELRLSHGLSVEETRHEVQDGELVVCGSVGKHTTFVKDTNIMLTITVHGLTATIPLQLVSGTPQSLIFKDNNSEKKNICLLSTDFMPDIVLVCLDEHGNRCWNKNYKVQCASAMSARQQSALESPGEIKFEKLHVAGQPGEYSITFSIVSKKKKIGRPCVCTVTVEQSNEPAKIVLKRGQTIVTSASFEAVAGTMLQIGVEVVDVIGRPCAEVAGLEKGWAGDDLVNIRKGSGRFSLQVPNRVGTEKFKLICKGTSVSAAFTITTTPGPIAKLEESAPFPTSFVCARSEPISFVAFDEFGNTIQSPEIDITFDNSEGILTASRVQAAQSRKRGAKRSSAGGEELIYTVTLCGPVGSYKIELSAPNGCLDIQYTVDLTAGPPHHLKLRSPTVLPVEVENNTTLPALAVEVLDEGGTQLNCYRGCMTMTCEALAIDDKATIVGGVSEFLREGAVIGKAGQEYTLVVTAECKLQRLDPVSPLPLEIPVRMIQGNFPTGLQLVDSPLYICAGAPMPQFKVKLVTEDGEPLDPPLDNLKGCMDDGDEEAEATIERSSADPDVFIAAFDCKAPQAAGVHDVRFRLLEGTAIGTVKFGVIAGPAASLFTSTKRPFKETVRSHTDAVKKAFTVRLKDEFGNVLHNPALPPHVKVTVAVVDDNGVDVPSLFQTTTHQLELEMKIKTLVMAEAPSGPYAVQFRCASLTPLTLDFHFANSADERREKDKEREERETLRRELEELEVEKERVEAEKEKLETRIAGLTKERKKIIAEERAANTSARSTGGAISQDRYEKAKEVMAQRGQRRTSQVEPGLHFHPGRSALSKSKVKDQLDIVACQAYCTDPEVNKAISEYLGFRMLTLVCERKHDADILYDEFGMMEVKATVMCIDCMEPFPSVRNGSDMYLELPQISSPGCLGHAVNLIVCKIPERRRTLFYTLLRDAIVFENRKYLDEYLERNGRVRNHLISLCGYVLRGSVVRLGTHDPAPMQFSPHIPLDLDTEYQEALKTVRTYKDREALKQKTQKIHQALRGKKDALSSTIDAAQADRKQLAKQITALQKEIDALRSKLNQYGKKRTREEDTECPPAKRSRRR